MKYFLFLCLLIPLCCWGQFKVTGTLTDKEGKMVRAVFSQGDGSFIMEKLSVGEYTLTVHSVFYELFSYKFFLQTDLSLGILSLTEKVQELSETVYLTFYS